MGVLFAINTSKEAGVLLLLVKIVSRIKMAYTPGIRSVTTSYVVNHGRRLSLHI